jgi:hypothetical protein
MRHEVIHIIMKTADNDIREIEELEDGSSVYEIGPEVQKETDGSFYDNLADNFLKEEALKKLSSFLLDSIEQDINARKPWLDAIEKAKPYLGYSLEDLVDIPFKMATRTFDTTLATAHIRFYATTRAELLPQSGPAGFKINGVSNEELEKEGERIRDNLNNYLTIVDKAYYSDYERFLIYLGFYGSGFRKVYFDKLLNRPLSRFIIPEDFIIDSDCTSILESNRLTHVLHLSKREILLNQQNGIYRDVELPYLKSLENTDSDSLTKNLNKNKEEINLNAYIKRSLFSIYEVHSYLNLDDFINEGSNTDNNVPLPYIITIDENSKEILSVRRNWEENDPEKKRINYFVQYNYLPGFGIYGLGLAQLIGPNAISLTTILRELIDAGKFKNLPGGLRQKGLKQQENDLVVGPGQFVEVNTGGIPLQEAFMPLPYSEPSQTLRELRIELMNQTKELGSTSEMGMLESKEDIPTGTAMAFLETNNRIQSTVLRSIHYSLSNELQLIDRFLRDPSDFTEEIQIIPISDPATNSTVQRIMKAQATMQLATQAPDLHNMREVFKLNYQAQGLDEKDIDRILKPDEKEQQEQILPLDPISENVNAMKGLPIKAAMWQEHAAHKLTHALFAEQNPDLQPILMAHIKEHDAFAYLIEMQQMLGQELPPLEEIQDPQVQNAIAMAIAGALEQSGATASQEQAPIDPNALLMADIQQKEAETAAKERIANLKAETDVFKAQLDFEKEKAKIESEEDIAKLKSETELIKQGVSNENY